jgi:hypothetical protein
LFYFNLLILLIKATLKIARALLKSVAATGLVLHARQLGEALRQANPFPAATVLPPLREDITLPQEGEWRITNGE